MDAPKKIKLDKEKSCLVIIWQNNVTHELPLKFLRDESPDAGNKGETILWRHYDPPKKEKKETPEMYQVENIIPVGSYGIQIVWKDGFDDGIYSWDLLWRFGEYMEVKNSLSADFEHDHNHNHKEGKK
jgi:DUF971 family protein